MRVDALRFQRMRPLVIGGNNYVPVYQVPGAAPVPISTQVDAGIAYQAAIALPSGTLRNQSQEPVLVDEIRITLNAWEDPAAPTDPYPPGLQAQDGPRPDMGIELKLGNVALTRNFVPYALFGNRISSPFILPTQSWRLPTPLWLAPGEEISARFQCTTSESAYGDAPFYGAANITLVGRALERCQTMPTSIAVPYITWYQGPIRPTGTDWIDDTDSTDLANPFDVPMRVQRFVGSILDPLYETNGFSTHQAYTISMVDHLANPTIRNPAQWATVFSAIDKSWPVHTKLPPKGFYIGTINANLTDDWQYSDLRAIIGMIGTREVRLA